MTFDLADFEVRLTPLLKGIPEQPEGPPEGSTIIEESDTVLVTQYSNLKVELEHNEGRTAELSISMHDATVIGLERYKFAIWIGYCRPGETISEAIFFSQCNLSDDFTNEVCKLTAQDRSEPCQHHYIRRGDEALQINGVPDGQRGRIEASPYSFDMIVEAARNIDLQQDRSVPILGLKVREWGVFDNPDIWESPALIDFERGQEVWDFLQQLINSEIGPDIDNLPQWFFPIQGHYNEMWLYDAPTPESHEAPGEFELGRNLDPVDPDNPSDSEVVWDFGMGHDNCLAFEVEPEHPTTHVHVLDSNKAFRVTAADADSSADHGVWVDWIETDYVIQRATPTSDPDLRPLEARARDHIRAYGQPVSHVKITLDPDDVQMRHFGHPQWAASVGEGIPRIGGTWYIGDRVRVRAQKGNRFFTDRTRIVKVIFSRAASNDLVRVDVELIPGPGGNPGPDEEETGTVTDTIAPSVALTAPSDGTTVDESFVVISADATDDVGVAEVQFYLDGVLIGGDTTFPYSILWDPSAASEGVHILTATALDAAGNSTTSDPVSVTVDHIVDPEPPPPPPTGVLRVLDGVIVDSDDVPVAPMTGGNIHTLPDYVPSVDYLTQFKDRGGKFLRIICVPYRHNPAPGVWDSLQRSNLDLAIQRMHDLGIFIELELHLNVGAVPSHWTTGIGETEKYNNHGQFITQAMAARYGNPSSPYYSPFVTGFGLNEIPLDNDATRNGNNAIPFLEQVQRNMIAWMRAPGYAPNWIGYVNLGYACQTPYPDSPRVQADPNAYDSVGGNVVMDLHDYGAGTTSSDPSDDGRQANGNIQPTYQGGRLYWQISGQPITYSSNATKRSQMARFYDDYQTYCAAAGMALMVGETNWMRANGSGKAAWWTDKRQAISDAGCQIALLWELTASNNDWASTPGGVWDSEAETFLAGGWL